MSDTAFQSALDNDDEYAIAMEARRAREAEWTWGETAAALVRQINDLKARAAKSVKVAPSSARMSCHDHGNCELCDEIENQTYRLGAELAEEKCNVLRMRDAKDAEIAALERIIKEAPHGVNCRSNIMSYWDTESNCAFPCSCWKSKARTR
jgi:hypothetical protein